MRPTLPRFAAIAVFTLRTMSLGAQATPVRTPLEFDMREEMIPMRDGVKLHTTIFAQKGIAQPRPFIMTRTPYGIAGGARAMNAQYSDLADAKRPRIS